MLKTNCKSFKYNFAVCDFLNLSEEQHLNIQVIQICIKNDKYLLFYKGEEEDVDNLNKLFDDMYSKDYN